MASLLGGLLVILVRIPQFTIFGDQPLAVIAKKPLFMPLLGLPSLIACILIIFGVIGIYFVYATNAGGFGLFAFLTAFIGVMLSIGANWTYAFISPILARNVPGVLEGDPSGKGIVTAIMVSYLIAQIGILLMGISMLRWDKFPKWLPASIIASFVMVAILSPFADTSFLRIFYNVLIGYSPMAIGYYLYNYS